MQQDPYKAAIKVFLFYAVFGLVAFAFGFLYGSLLFILGLYAGYVAANKVFNKLATPEQKQEGLKAGLEKMIAKRRH